MKTIKSWVNNPGLNMVHKFTIFALYSLPTSFINFEVFEPFFDPNKRKRKTYFSILWIEKEIKKAKKGLGRDELPINESFNSEFLVFKSEMFNYIAESAFFNHILMYYIFEGYQRKIRFFIQEYKAAPNRVLKMAIFERSDVVLPVAIYLHFNPKAINNYENDEILPGFFNIHGHDRSSEIKAFDFLMQAMAELSNKTIISKTFTDVVRRYLKNFIRRRYQLLFGNVFI
jgi:hypothetical protein